MSRAGTKLILGIETSCDETALALIETRGEGASFECRVLGSLVHSQAALHSAYGGVYPSLAKREHGKNLVPLLHKLLIETSELMPATGARGEVAIDLEKLKNEVAPQNPELYEAIAGAAFLKHIPAIDLIAVTEGPGLEPALWTGITFTRVLSEIWQIPVVPVNHMEGHVVGSLIPSDATNGAWQRLSDIPLPAVAFLISGGHTQLIRAEKLGHYEILGETVDDAVGEAFDKAARLLGLGYPGGPYLSKMAQEARDRGIDAPVKLPRPMLASGDLKFSFSGLKTAVLYAVGKAGDAVSDDWKRGLAREFEDAVVETLEKKLRKALDEVGAGSIIVGGGVAANHVIREHFKTVASEYGIPIYMPSQHLSGDNALMIAVAGAVNPKTSKELRAHGTKKLGS